MTSDYEGLIEELLAKRNLRDAIARDKFLNPSYDKHLHDPFLLPDMKAAVSRIKQAREKNQKIVIYGDYDIDGLTASTVLSEAFKSFDINHEVYIPDRFEEGYGLNEAAIEQIAESGAQLVITVDCGSVSFEPIERANSLGLDVIVTDHHTVGETLPDAIGVINPKRTDSKYPFADLAGVGVAFKLVCALQTEIPGFPLGQEKWLLDLVALGTVCDVVDLVDENRVIVYWGLRVAKKTRRPGLKALAEVSNTELEAIDTTTFGFRFGPRLNASGRLENARMSLDLLRASDTKEAQMLAQELDSLNSERRNLQNNIFKEADELANQDKDPVLILGGKGWSQGVVGIVAAKLLEKHKKPTFVFEIMNETMKGSARSFGDFKAVDAVRAAKEYLISGGGHAAAAGCTIKTEDFENFKTAIINHYNSLNLVDQKQLLDPKADATIETPSIISLALIDELSLLEPHGNANPMPLFCLRNNTVREVKYMGQTQAHVRVNFASSQGDKFEAVGFNMREAFEELGSSTVDLWFHIEKNTFRGNSSAQIRLVKVA